MLDKIKGIWQFIDKIDSSIKTFIIICLTLLLIPKLVMKYYSQYYDDKVQEAEDYSMQTGPIIESELRNILNADQNVSCVLLLNYHNTKTNPEGYSFKYVSCLAEVARDESHRNHWVDLDYISYSTEIMRINNRKYLRSYDIEDMKESFPRFYNKLKSCNIHGVAIYPVHGYKRQLGLLVMLYSDKMTERTDTYYQTTISQPLQKIQSILDYNNNKHKWFLNE